MKKYRFPLATSSWDHAEQEALQRVIASDRFSMGPEVAQFETEFARYMGTRYAIMVNSGSSANLLMIAALFFTKERARLKRGDEVIVPAIGWSTTYAPLQQYGLHLKFVDIDLETLNFDLDQLAASISGRTRAILAVNLLGNPNDFARIQELIAGHDIVLLEDNCESMGAVFDNRQAGTFGLAGTFSSYFSHHISTMEGGLVVTDDEELCHVMLSIRAHGWTRNLPKVNKVTGEKSDDDFKESFRFVLPGYNLRPLEMSGALGQAQLAKLPGLVEGRRRNGRAFQDAMADHPNIMIQREIGESSWFGFSLILRPESGMSRAELLAALDREQFESRPIVTGNFLKNEVVRFMDYSVAEGGTPNAEYADVNGLFIGNHHYAIDEAFGLLAAL